MVKMTVPVTRGGNSLQLGPQDGGQAELSADGGQRGDVGEADAHDYRQPGADAPEDREQLEQRGQGCDDEGRLDQRSFLIGAQAAHLAARNDERRSDHAHDGGHHVLQPQWDQLTRRRDTLICKDAGAPVRWPVHPYRSPFAAT